MAFPPTELARLERTAGAVALACVAGNVLWHVNDGRWFDAFWLCNLAAVAAGLGLMLRSALLASVGFIWLVPGTAAWSVEALVLGSTFSPASYALHVGGTSAALLGVWRLGTHRKGYVAALALLAALLLGSRLLPEAANVNCAFGPRDGWALFEWLPLPYLASVALVGLVLSYAMNQLGLLLSARRSPLPDPRR